LIFALVLTALFDYRKTQVIINFVVFTVFVLYVLGLQPANTNFWRIEQCIVHLLLWVAKLFIFMLVIDDDREDWSGNKRWKIGYVPIILAFIVICWNTLVLIGMWIYHMYLCK